MGESVTGGGPQIGKKNNNSAVMNLPSVTVDCVKGVTLLLRPATKAEKTTKYYLFESTREINQ